MIKVVAALLEKENKVFIAKRLKGKYENKWEFPGGKVEPGETEKAAIEREIKEEFNLNVKAIDFVCNNIHEYTDIVVDLRLYKCKFISGEIYMIDHKESIWIEKERLLEYDFAPADIPIVKFIVEGKYE